MTKNKLHKPVIGYSKKMRGKHGIGNSGGTEVARQIAHEPKSAAVCELCGDTPAMLRRVRGGDKPVLLCRSCWNEIKDNPYA